MEKNDKRIGDLMKFLFWQLDSKEKFIRAFWTGLVALIALYVVCWFVIDDLIIKLVIPSALTILFIVDLLLRYQKMKRMEVQS